MRCRECLKNIPDESKFCLFCGAKICISAKDDNSATIDNYLNTDSTTLKSSNNTIAVSPDERKKQFEEWFLTSSSYNPKSLRQTLIALEHASGFAGQNVFSISDPDGIAVFIEKVTRNFDLKYEEARRRVSKLKSAISIYSDFLSGIYSVDYSARKTETTPVTSEHYQSIRPKYQYNLSPDRADRALQSSAMNEALLEEWYRKSYKSSGSKAKGFKSKLKRIEYWYKKDIFAITDVNELDTALMCALSNYDVNLKAGRLSVNEISAAAEVYSEYLNLLSIVASKQRDCYATAANDFEEIKPTVTCETELVLEPSEGKRENNVEDTPNARDLTIALDETDLAWRAVQTLYKNDVFTISDLIKLSDKELRRIFPNGKNDYGKAKEFRDFQLSSTGKANTPTDTIFNCEEYAEIESVGHIPTEMSEELSDDTVCSVSGEILKPQIVPPALISPAIEEAEIAIGNKDLMESQAVCEKVCTDEKDLADDNCEVRFFEKYQVDTTKYRQFPIENLRLSNRSYNALKHSGINTVEELLFLTPADLAQTKNIGKKSLDEVTFLISAICSGNYNALRDLDVLEFHSCIQLAEIEFARKHRNEIAAGDFSFADNIEISDTFREKLDEYRDAVKIVDEELVHRCYDSTLYISAIQDELFKFYHETTIAKERKVRLEAALSVVPADRQEKCAELYINAYTQDVMKRRCLIDAISNYRKISDFRLITTSSSDEVFFVVEDFLNWCAFDIREEISQIFETNVVFRNELDKEVMATRAKSTLEECGKKFNRTKERIRQIEKRVINAFHKWVNKSNILYKIYAEVDGNALLNISTLREFCGYNADTLFYLLKKEIETDPRYYYHEILNVIYISEYIERSEENDVPVMEDDSNFVIIGAERVRLKKLPLMIYAIKSALPNYVSYEEMEARYNRIVMDLGLEGNPSLKLKGKNHENQLKESNMVLWTLGKKYRYYDLTDYNFDELLLELGLDEYRDVEISTLKFFSENPALMAKYNIQDEYELHCLLGKICPEELLSRINFCRMPTIVFGTADRETQVLELLVSSAPIEKDAFYKLYEETYGIKAGTVAANYVSCISKYLQGTRYVMDFPQMANDMLVTMRGLLDAQYYPLDIIKEILLTAYPGADSKLINTLNLSALGYKVYSGYVISDKYSSASVFFNRLIESQESFSQENLPRGVFSNSTFSVQLYKKRSTFEIVEFMPGNYLNISRFKSIGVDELDFAGYIDAVKAFVGQEKYFTVKSIREAGFEHKLDNLGFEDWFYSSLLIEDKESFSYMRIGGTRLIKKSKSSFSFDSFIEEIVYAQEGLSIDIFDILSILINTYGISVDRYKLIETVRNSEMYYDSITERIYAEYDVYFEEI